MNMNKYFFAMSDDDNDEQFLDDMLEIFKQLPKQLPYQPVDPVAQQSAINAFNNPKTPIMDEEILEIMSIMGMNVAEMQSVMRSEIWIRQITVKVT